MHFNILTLFPELFIPYQQAGIIGRALAQKVIELSLYNIRDYATDKHKTVDDTPYGGGAGMVMKVEPIDRTLAAVNQATPREQQHIIVLSANGRPFTQQRAQELAQRQKVLTLICGRYEGIDQRVIEYLADEAISIGPYVVAGGELPALVMIETIARLVPGVLGNPDSLQEESFTLEGGEYPHYTKPEDYKGWKVPPVLLSGNHAAIKKWRDDQRRGMV
jgi:tRNA (guanine37-N1)-methyltransferase